MKSKRKILPCPTCHTPYKIPGPYVLDMTSEDNEIWANILCGIGKTHKKLLGSMTAFAIYVLTFFAAFNALVYLTVTPAWLTVTIMVSLLALVGWKTVAIGRLKDKGLRLLEERRELLQKYLKNPDDEYEVNSTTYGSKTDGSWRLLRLIRYWVGKKEDRLFSWNIAKPAKSAWFA